MHSTLKTWLISISMTCCSLHVECVVTDDACAQEALMSNFPVTIVHESLVKFNIPEDQHHAIAQELEEKDKEFLQRLEKKASEFESNPFQDPQQRQTAIKIFRETLQEIFFEVMKSHGIQDEKVLLKMLEEIQLQKAKQFAQCIDAQKQSASVNTIPQAIENNIE